MQVRRVRVQIETTRGRVVGTIRLPIEGYRSRTTDFLNAHETGFIALTEASIEGPGGMQEHAYVAIGCRHIVMAAEVEDLGVEEGDELPLPGEATLGPTTSIPPPGL